MLKNDIEYETLSLRIVLEQSFLGSCDSTFSIDQKMT